MKKDIIINGISVEELKRQRVAIQKDAAKIIAENIDAATALVHKIVKAESKDQALTLAEEAYEHLDTAQVVSGVSGVEFFLPFYEEYGRYDPSEILSSMLDQEHLDENDVNENIEFNWQDKNALYQLYQKLGDMESDSRAWHSSMC